MYQYRHLIRQNIAPKGAQHIVALDAQGNEVARIPLGPLAPPTTAPLYSFGLLSDLHLWKTTSSWDGNTKFDNALAYLQSQGCVFCAHCGDITQTGLYDEGNTTTLAPAQFEVYKSICDKYTMPVYGICGNHESLAGVPIANNLTELKQYTGTDLYYAVEQGDDLFIFLGQPNYNKVMGDDALTWLQETLESNSDRRCFVFIHSYIEEDSGDAVDYRENSVFDDWGTAKTNAFMELLRQHPNVILFHGHSHMKLECQRYDVNANYTERNGFKSVHVPSVGKPRDVDLETGATPEDYGASEGYIVDVYADCIVLRGWDFVGGAPSALGTFKIGT